MLRKWSKFLIVLILVDEEGNGLVAHIDESQEGNIEYDQHNNSWILKN